jgi:bifunctional UDP-N-acetylglucosamine pyrophosphorylase/glucosamine-1-phosphate N-acetyltransferase
VTRALIIPAAGIGSRLRSSWPKVLHPVNGRPMIDYLFELYGRDVARMVFVVRPADLAQVRDYCARAPAAAPVACEFAVQERPTGMLDAILLAHDVLSVDPPGRVWITWCDQIGILPETVRRLRDASDAVPPPALAMPTAMRREPYIHLARDTAGRITQVLHRREGDAMPDEGETDAGLFSMSREAYFDLLPQYAATLTHEGAATRERNFLPFIPWLHARAEVHTFPCVSWIESVGVNTPEDAALVAPNLPSVRGL